MGHSAILCDFPSTEPAPNLQVERELGLRPYWIRSGLIRFSVGGRMVIHPIAPVEQIRISEYVSEPLGAFGDRTVRQIRILSRGGWQIWRKGEGGWALYDEGTTSLPVIPLAVTYSGKVSELISNPPLLEIAQINILHGQRQRRFAAQSACCGAADHVSEGLGRHGQHHWLVIQQRDPASK